MLSQFLGGVVGVDESVDCVRYLTGWVIFMQLTLDSLFAELPIELNGGHMHEPQILFDSSIVVSFHFQVELDFSFVLGLVHEDVYLKWVDRQ